MGQRKWQNAVSSPVLAIGKSRVCSAFGYRIVCKLYSQRENLKMAIEGDVARAVEHPLEFNEI